MFLRTSWIAVSLLFLNTSAFADTRFTAVLTGAQETPAVATAALGNGTLILNTAENSVTVSADYFGLSGAPTAAHVHGPADPGMSASPIITLSPLPATSSGVIAPQVQAVTPAEVADIKAGRWYFNIHTTNFGGGEIRGRIVEHQPRFTGFLSADQEVPVVNSPLARGFGSLLLNDAETGIDIVLSFANLSSAQTMSHIHGPALPNGTGGVLIDIGTAPGAVTQGEIRATRAISRLQLAQLRAGLTYFNVHSSNFGSGEIRAQVRPSMPVFAVIDGAQHVPPNVTTGRGFMRVYLDYPRIGGFGELTVTNMATTTTALELRGPALPGSTGVLVPPAVPIPGLTNVRAVNIPLTLSVNAVTGYFSGLLYVQINSGTTTSQIRGQIDGLMQDGSE